MHINSFFSSLIFFVMIFACAVTGVLAENLTSLGEENSTAITITTNSSADTAANLTNDGGGNVTTNQTLNQTLESEITGTSYDEALNTEVQNESPVEVYTGTEHPNEETDVKSSTPSGDPLLGKYAQGGVSIDIGANLMEGRGSDLNVSSEISLKDHTSANGYIRTIQKDFHYMSSVDSDENT